MAVEPATPDRAGARPYQRLEEYTTLNPRITVTVGVFDNLSQKTPGELHRQARAASPERTRPVATSSSIQS
jgi:hypothetical protein